MTEVYDEYASDNIKSIYDSLSLLFGFLLLMGLNNSKLLILAIYSCSFIGLSVIQELRSRIMLRMFATVQD
ncbi:hypothetical protein ACTGYP_10295 [Streptococcus suis]